MMNVISVDLSKQELMEIPMGKIREDANWIILSDNKLRVISEGISNFYHLTRLALNDNRIETIHKNIGECHGITWIDLTRNKLKTLPLEMGNLRKITGLGLSENEFEEIPECIYKLQNLRKFGFFSNKISFISGTIKNLHNLVKLDLSNNRLENLPDEFCHLTNLTWLNLSNNKIKSLPDGMNKLVKLEELGLGSNELEELPDISTLKKLRIMPVFKNKLKKIHPGVFKLPQIEKLDFSDNRISEFPSECLSCKSLHYLNLRNNQIASISPYIFEGKISSIGMIDLSENKLKYLPYKFFKAFTERTIIRLGLNPYKLLQPIFPPHQSLMQICFTKILNKNSKIDPWINSLFKKHLCCDQCRSLFVTEPYFTYYYSYLESDSHFVIEKMVCSLRCMRHSMNK